MSQLRVIPHGDWVEITLNRPEVRNALSPTLIRELTQFFLQPLVPTVRAVVLQGAGESFCAGADIEVMREQKKFSLEENLADAGRLYDMFHAMRSCARPIVTLVQGHVMGGALGFLACSDVVVAESKTKFCFSEVRLGIVPGVISRFCLERIGPAAAFRWMTTAEVFTVGQALEMSLVTEIVERPNLESRRDELLALYRQVSPSAVAVTKKLLNQHLASPQEARTRSVEAIAHQRVSSEGQEGLSAFLEKRKPIWSPS